MHAASNVKIIDGETFVNNCLNDGSATSMQSRLRPFHPTLFGFETFFVVELDGEVQALGNIILEGDQFSLSYVTVDDRFRNRGIGTAIVERIRDHLAELGQVSLPHSSFTPDGAKFLKHVLRRKFPKPR